MKYFDSFVEDIVKAFREDKDREEFEKDVREVCRLYGVDWRLQELDDDR